MAKSIQAIIADTVSKSKKLFDKGEILEAPARIDVMTAMIIDARIRVNLNPVPMKSWRTSSSSKTYVSTRKMLIRWFARSIANSSKNSGPLA